MSRYETAPRGPAAFLIHQPINFSEWVIQLYIYETELELEPSLAFLRKEEGVWLGVHE